MRPLPATISSKSWFRRQKHTIYPSEAKTIKPNNDSPEIVAGSGRKKNPPPFFENIFVKLFPKFFSRRLDKNSWF